MNKRTPIDLTALTAMTSDEATTMPEATQRSPAAVTSVKKPPAKKERRAIVETEFTESLNFKVDAGFRERYRILAAKAGLKLNELLYEAVEAWEAKQK